MDIFSGWQILTFLLGSAGLAWVSRRSLRNLRQPTHGLFRFLAWEAILALLVRNLERWFVDPLAPHQLASWGLLCLSLYPLIAGVQAMRRAGGSDPARRDPDLYGFEKTSALVTAGIFGHIRHPMYCSLLGLAWGIFFKDPAWTSGLLALAASGFLTATARVEEGENLRTFGPAYAEYMRRSKMFIPLLF